MGQGARPPVTRKLPFLKSYRDRHGKARHYLRLKGCDPVAIPGEYGSREFTDAYWSARENTAKREIGAERITPGSFSALIAIYYKSKAYTGLKDITRKTYRNVIERFREDHGALPVKGVRQRHVVAILDGLAGNTHTWRTVIRLLLNLALERGWIDVHPMAGMRRQKRAAKGFVAWSETDIAAYEAKWPTGSRERLALALLLYTAQRRADVVTMGRQHIRGDQIHVVQQKTEARLWIPLAPPLRAEIAMVPATQLTLLQTQAGEPFTANGFGNWFREAAVAAGVTGRAHGLRKSASVRLAEAGCTPTQIKAVTGHKNLAEVTLYTEAADQERLAREAMRKLEGRTKRLTPGSPVRQTGGKA